MELHVPPQVDEGTDVQAHNISIPADMVGYIIGRGGSKISEICKSSGARISIAKAAHDESGERMFTITGGPGANEKALHLLCENLEAQMMHRSQIPEAAAPSLAQQAGPSGDQTRTGFQLRPIIAPEGRLQ